MNIDNEENDNFDSMCQFIFENIELKEIINDYCFHIWDKQNLFLVIFSFGKKYLNKNYELK